MGNDTHALPQQAREGIWSQLFLILWTVEATLQKHLQKTKQDIALKISILIAAMWLSSSVLDYYS